MSGFLNRINTELNYLSNVESKIAAFILKDPREFIGLSMAEVSEKAGVSQGSINNFAKKYANCGFAELKLLVAGELGKNQSNQYTIVDAADGVKDVFKKSMDRANVAFESTLKLNGEHTLKSVADKIMQAKRIEIYGIFHSGIVARDLHFQMLRLGLPAMHTDDVLMFPVSAAMLDPECLVIAISSSGRTKDILDAVEIAKSNGVSVICITSNSHSPLAKISDDVLVSSAGTAALSNSVEQTRLSQLLLVDSLCSYIRYQTDANGNKRYFRLTGILNSHSVED